MQFGNSTRAFTLGCAFFLAVFGSCIALAQTLSQYDQVLSGTSDQQQLPCGAADPTCQQAGEAGRTPSVNVPTQQTPQGATIPGQTGTENSQSNTQNTR